MQARLFTKNAKEPQVKLWLAPELAPDSVDLEIAWGLVCADSRRNRVKEGVQCRQWG